MGAERNVCEFLAAPPRPTHPAFPRRTPPRSGLGRRHTERFPQRPGNARFAAACRNCHERPCIFHHLRWLRKACFLCHHTPILRGPPILAPSAAKKSRIAAAISFAWVSSAKWPVSKKWIMAPGISRLNASAPPGRKKGSFFPQTARKRGL